MRTNRSKTTSRRQSLALRRMGPAGLGRCPGCGRASAPASTRGSAPRRPSARAASATFRGRTPLSRAAAPRAACTCARSL